MFSGHNHHIPDQDEQLFSIVMVIKATDGFALWFVWELQTKNSSKFSLANSCKCEASMEKEFRDTKTTAKWMIREYGTALGLFSWCLFISQNPLVNIIWIIGLITACKLRHLWQSLFYEWSGCPHQTDDLLIGLCYLMSHRMTQDI